MTTLLHYFHITHTKADYKHSLESDEKAEVVSKWEKIRAVSEEIGKCEGAVKIFQEGVYTDKALSAIRNRNSPNGDVLRYLIDHGAVLIVPFENIEYAEWVKFLVAEGLADPPRINPPTYGLLWTLLNIFRNSFMAEKINSNLAEHETGVLFLGGDHRIQELLSPKIQILHYFGKSDSEIAMRTRLTQQFHQIIDRVRREQDFNQVRMIFKQVQGLCLRISPGESVSADPLFFAPPEMQDCGRMT